MDIPDIDDHLTCYNYEHTQKPVIQVLSPTRGSRIHLTGIYNKIIFILQQKEKYILFVPANKAFKFRATGECTIFIFRLLTPVGLCEGYSPEMLYKDGSSRFKVPHSYEEGKPGRIGLLAPVSHFLEGIGMGIDNGMKCRCWFDMKIMEFFMLLRVYYPKEELYKFLYPAISGDLEFSARVLENWREHPTVEELAVFMNMTTRQLSARFMAVFGITPGKWMIRERAKLVHREIICTNKSFSQIAIENGFTAESVFTHFCTREFGKTPSRLRGKKKDDWRQKSKEG